MKNHVSGASSGSSYSSYVPPSEGGGQGGGSAPMARLPSSEVPATRVSAGPAAPRAPSQTSRIGGWLAALTGSQPSQAPEQQPLLEAEGSGKQPLPRLAPPARGGALFQAYADIHMVTSSEGGNGRWPATIQYNVEQEVKRTARGEIPEHERQEVLAELVGVQKSRLDGGSGGS